MFINETKKFVMKRSLFHYFTIIFVCFSQSGDAQLQINSGSQYLMNIAKDMSSDFGDAQAKECTEDSSRWAAREN